MAETQVLPPHVALEAVWARTGEFGRKRDSGRSPTKTDKQGDDGRPSETTDRWKLLRERAASDARERTYVESAIVLMEAAERNLEIVYKGRQLNFGENQRIRDAYLESIQSAIQIGKDAKDVLRLWPGITIGGLTGYTAASNWGLSDTTIWIVGAIAAAIGYFGDATIRKVAAGFRQYHYVAQDYDRNLYYAHYVARAEKTLEHLYDELISIHSNVFGSAPAGVRPAAEVAAAVVAPVAPLNCPYIHDHMRQGLITPSLWPICETGLPESRQKCPFWRPLPAANEPPRAAPRRLTNAVPRVTRAVGMRLFK